MLNVMYSNADDIKIVAKLGKGESLPFGVMQVCVKWAYLLYDVVNWCSLRRFCNTKHGNLRTFHLQMTAFCSKSFGHLPVAVFYAM